MKFIKIMMACTIFVIALIVISCQKVQYKSRDTSSLKPPPADTTPVVIDTSAVFDNCDALGAWQVVGSPAEITTGQKEGKGFIQATLATGQNFEQFIDPLATPVNTKVTLSTGELKFWFYVQDVTQLKSGQVQFSSSGTPDNNRIGWDLATIIPTLQTGWNFLQLKFSDPGAQITGDGGPDLTKMNFFKLFFNTTGNVTTAQNYGIDDIRVAVVPPPPPVEIDNCDAINAWQVVGAPTLVTTGQKEGKGYIQATLAVGQSFEQFIDVLATPVNTTQTIATGQFQFWFYVQDVSQLKDGQIQFSSSGGPDQNRIGWDLTTIIPTLKNGWNHVQLSFSDPAAEITGDGGPNLAAMNFIKIFFDTTGNVTTAQNYGVDDFEVVFK